MTLLEHTYAIRNLLTKGPASKDTRISLELIAHFLKVSRALLTEQKADKYNFISEQSFQSLCVPLVKGSLHNCCDYPASKCLLLKSSSPIPKTLSTRWGDLSKVTTLSGEVLSKTSVTANKLAKYSLTNKTPKPGWFIHDNHLYVINNNLLEVVLLNTLFAEPDAVLQSNCIVNNTTCPGLLDSEFPVDPDLIDGIYRKTLDFLVTAFKLPKVDAENDATDSQVSG